MGSAPTLNEFAEAEGLTTRGRVCGVCRMHAPDLIAIVDDNERLDKTDPRKVSRKVVALYLKSVYGYTISVGALDGHAKRHIK